MLVKIFNYYRATTLSIQITTTTPITATPTARDHPRPSHPWINYNKSTTILCSVTTTIELSTATLTTIAITTISIAITTITVIVMLVISMDMGNKWVQIMGCLTHMCTTSRSKMTTSTQRKRVQTTPKAPVSAMTSEVNRNRKYHSRSQASLTHPTPAPAGSPAEMAATITTTPTPMTISTNPAPPITPKLTILHTHPP